MENQPEKESSYVKDELNQAFVDGELNKTVNVSTQNSNWNLLEDPQLLKDEENDNYDEDFMQFQEKEVRNYLNIPIGGMQSSIQFNQKSLKSKINNPNNSKKSVEDDDEEDLKDMLNVFKKNEIQKK